MTTDAPILVAVGLDGSGAAVAYAAAEATLLHAPLHLVHVVRFPAVEPYAAVYDDVLSDADATLAAAAARARHLTADAVPVTVERVDRGALVPDLVRRAEEARMAVLQHRRLGQVRRFMTGSTVKGVAARAGVPLVSVPEGWPEAAGTGRVTVGVQDAGEAGAVLRAAFAAAAVRDARLTVLHASWLDDGFGMPVLVDPTDRSRAADQVRTELATPLAECAREFPGVDVDVEVHFARPAETLVDAGAGSDLLVLGRRHHRMPLASHLGPVARTVLDHTSCPVLLAPEEHADHRIHRSRLTGLRH